MSKSGLVTPFLIRQLLDYDPSSGKLTWKKRTLESDPRGKSTKRSVAVFNARYAGTEAFAYIGANGYKQGPILKEQHTAHRAAWAHFHGVWPDKIDHINGKRDDNRLANLRSVTKSENSRNACTPSTNTSGILGVSWHKQCAKWNAYIKIDGKRKSLGLYSALEDAAEARRMANVVYGFHPNHGRAA